MTFLSQCFSVPLCERQTLSKIFVVRKVLLFSMGSLGVVFDVASSGFYIVIFCRAGPGPAVCHILHVFLGGTVWHNGRHARLWCGLTLSHCQTTGKGMFDFEFDLRGKLTAKAMKKVPCNIFVTLKRSQKKLCSVSISLLTFMCPFGVQNIEYLS